MVKKYIDHIKTLTSNLVRRFQICSSIYISTYCLSKISQVQLNMETIIRCGVLVLVTMVFVASHGGKFSV